MSRHTPARFALAALALLGAAACSDKPTEPRDDDPRLTADLAINAGDEIASDVALLSWGATEATTGGGFGPTAAFVAARASARAAAEGPPCPFSSARFTCPALQTADYTFTRSYQLFDANGVVQSAYNDATTASINLQSVTDGSATAPGRTVSLHSERDVTVSGLAGAETRREWNGTGVTAVDASSTRDGTTRSFSYVSLDTVSHLVFGLPRLTNPYPLSGQIVRSVAASVGRDDGQPVLNSFRRRVVATFDGTSKARLQVGVRSCTLDLATKAVSCG